MWELAVASAVIQGIGYNEQARAAKMEGKLAARNIEQQQKMAQLQAMQEHNAILSQLESYKNTNAAITGIMGRDLGSDKSLKALRDKARKDNIKTIQRANLQSLSEVSKLSQQAQMAKVKASNLSKAYRLQAMSAIVSGGYKATQV